MTLDPADLKLRIDEAFGEMPYPGDEHIVLCDCWECEAIKSALKGLHWRDVSFDLLDNLRDALAFMSPEGWRFYLPAYMLISVIDFNRADVIPTTLINHLTPKYASDIDRMAEEIASWPREGPFSSIDWERHTEMLVGQLSWTWPFAPLAFWSAVPAGKSALLRHQNGNTQDN